MEYAQFLQVAFGSRARADLPDGTQRRLRLHGRRDRRNLLIELGGRIAAAIAALKESITPLA